MMLRRRVVLTSLAIAVPATALITYPVGAMRTRDLQVALERVVRSQMNDAVRERCDTDPEWFLTGPLEGRPPIGQRPDPNSDAVPPRPKTEAQPFELFGYDEDFIGSSPASPRLPPAFRDALRSSPAPVRGFYDTPNGKGVEIALATGWMGSPCRYLFGRLEPTPGERTDRLWFTALVFVACFGIGLAALGEVTWRVRKLAKAARESATGGYTAIAPDRLKDELSSLAFVFNDASRELALRASRIDDQDAALKRFVQSTDEDVAQPLASLERTLGEMALASGAGADAHTRQALQQAHDLSARIENLTAAARLRMSPAETIAATNIDLGALVARVVDRHVGVAHAAGVVLRPSLVVDRPVIVRADARLLERAVANVIDNAIRYNRPGGEVAVSLARDEGERFRLRVEDNGRGVSDDEFRGLTAVRRFRGDEHRIRRPGQPGLGLAVAREVTDRFGLTLDLSRPAAGFAVEIGGRVAG